MVYLINVKRIKDDIILSCEGKEIYLKYSEFTKNIDNVLPKGIFKSDAEKILANYSDILEFSKDLKKSIDKWVEEKSKNLEFGDLSIVFVQVSLTEYIFCPMNELIPELKRRKKTMCFCDFDVQKSRRKGKKLFIRENSLRSDNGVYHFHAEDGIEFLSEGGDKNIYLVRGHKIIKLAIRRKNKIELSQEKYSLNLDSKNNLVIKENTAWIKVKDGFVISPPEDIFFVGYMDSQGDDFAPVILRDLK